MILIEVVDDADHSHGYLQWVDFEANGPNYPTGDAKCTADRKQALTFADHAAAWDFFLTQSKTCPWRPDGQPNRPLTALNVKLVEA